LKDIIAQKFIQGPGGGAPEMSTLSHQEGIGDRGKAREPKGGRDPSTFHTWGHREYLCHCHGKSSPFRGEPSGAGCG